MDYELRQIKAFTMLGVAGGLEDIGRLWHLCRERFTDASLVSIDPAVMACAAEFVREGANIYVAGVPCLDEPAHLEGFVRYQVPGGRYALMHHRGPYSELSQIPGPLREALEAAGERPTDRWLELYRPLGAQGETHVEIGVLLSDD